ncbi:hypothetical protein NQ318_014652 [Aromia moschata]|uniref:Uncharacterized protein n=1 Tax=Aromia moschata TaxID=1265417 RepID=A0AAV8ZBS8_9CUCU|nr:hypothetical protein NQ318_014652 [Aromia moschata]
MNRRSTCAKMMPKLLTPEQKESRLHICADIPSNIDNDPGLLDTSRQRDAANADPLYYWIALYLIHSLNTYSVKEPATAAGGTKIEKPAATTMQLDFQRVMMLAAYNFNKNIRGLFNANSTHLSAWSIHTDIC